MELRNDFHVAMPAETAWQVLSDVERIAPCLPGAQLQEIEGDEYRGVVKVKVGPITAQYKGKATFVEQDRAGGRIVLKATGRDTGGGGNANATITATMVGDGYGGGTKVTVVTDLAITGRLAQFGRGVLAEVSTNLLGQFVACLEQTVLGAGSLASGSLQAARAESARTTSASASGQAAAPSALSAASGSSPSGPSAPSGAAPSGSAPSALSAASTSVSAEPAPVGSKPAPTGGGEARPPTSTGEDAVDVAPGDAARAGSSDGAASAPPTPPLAPAVRRFEGPEVEPVDLLEAARRSVAKRALPALAALGGVLAIVLWRRRR